jgi:hypothetical protein
MVAGPLIRAIVATLVTRVRVVDLRDIGGSMLVES